MKNSSVITVFTLGWTDDNKRFAGYRNKVITVASHAVMDDRIMVSHPVKISVRHFAMVKYVFR